MVGISEVASAEFQAAFLHHLIEVFGIVHHPDALELVLFLEYAVADCAADEQDAGPAGLYDRGVLLNQSCCFAASSGKYQRAAAANSTAGVHLRPFHTCFVKEFLDGTPCDGSEGGHTACIVKHFALAELRLV